MPQAYLSTLDDKIILNILDQGMREPLRIPLDEAAILKLITQGANILYNERRLYDVSSTRNLPRKRDPLRAEEQRGG